MILIIKFNDRKSFGITWQSSAPGEWSASGRFWVKCIFKIQPVGERQVGKIVPDSGKTANVVASERGGTAALALVAPLDR